MVATPSAITAPQRVVASNFKVVLANVDILAANTQTLTALRRLREALKSCSQRHLRYCMPRSYYRAGQPNRKLENPNDASCRRLHGLGVAHRCTQSQECFVRVLQSPQTRLAITAYLVLPKKCSQRYVKQRVQLRVRHGPLAHQNAQYLNQNMSPKRPAHTHNRRKALCTCDLVTPKNASQDLFAVIRCS